MHVVLQSIAIRSSIEFISKMFCKSEIACNGVNTIRCILDCGLHTPHPLHKHTTHVLRRMQCEDPRFADQEMVYNDIGKEMLEHAFEGLVFSTVECCLSLWMCGDRLMPDY